MSKYNRCAFAYSVVLLLVLFFVLSCGKKHTATGTGISTPVEDFYAYTEVLDAEEQGTEISELNSGLEDWEKQLPGEYVQEIMDEPRETFDAKLEKLDPPTDVKASKGTHNDKVIIHWSHPADGPAKPEKYSVFRSNKPDGVYDFIGGRSYPGSYYYDTSTSPGTIYYYKVRSHRTGYTFSDFSKTASGWMSLDLKAPTYVTASDGTFKDKIRIVWVHSFGVQPVSYEIYRSKKRNDLSPMYIGCCSYPVDTFDDTTFVTGTMYYYKVKATKKLYNDSGFSNEDKGIDLFSLQPPRDVESSNGVYNDKVAIHWNHPGSDSVAPDMYSVYRSETSGGVFEFLGGRSYPGTYYYDATAIPGKVYYYKVRSQKATEFKSEFSNSDDGWISDRMNAPVCVTASDGVYLDRVKIEWGHPGGVAPTSYYIYRSGTADDPNPQYIGNCSYPNAVYSDMTAETEKKYYYRIKSHKPGYNDSYFSREDSGYVPEHPYPPENVCASDGTLEGKIRIIWTHPTEEHTPTSYYVYRSTTPDDPNPKYIGSRAYPWTTYDDNNAQGGIRYYYKVRSHKSGYPDSGFSNEDSGKVADCWNFETISTEGSPNEYFSLALDSKGEPHTVYGERPDIIYASRDNGVWLKDVISTAYSSCWFFSLIFDKNDLPRFLFLHPLDNYDGEMMYVRHDGTSWVFETVIDKISLGCESTLRLDSADVPHLNTISNYMYLDGSSWISMRFDPQVSCDCTTLSLDSHDHPHIAYRAATDVFQLKYAFYDGSKWNSEIFDTGTIPSLSFALDRNDHPHICYKQYYDYYNSLLKYAHFDGSTWEIETIENKNIIGDCLSLSVDSNNRPHIAYCGDRTTDNDGDLKYAFFDGSSWEITRLDNAASTYSTSMITIDSKNHPHICYLDAFYNLKYVWFG